MESSIFFEKTFDANDLTDAIPEGTFTAGLTALDLFVDGQIAVKERASLDLTRDGETPNVFVTLVFDPTPLDETDNHLNTTTNAMLGDLHTFELPAAVIAAMKGIGTASVTATYNLTAEYSLGMGLDFRGAFNITALKAEFGGSLVPDFLSFSETVYEARLPEDGLGFSFIIPGITSHSVNSFNSITEVYDIAFSDIVPFGYDAESPEGDDALLDFIYDIQNSSLFSLPDVFSIATSDIEDISNAGSIDARTRSNESEKHAFTFFRGETTITGFSCPLL